MSLVEAALKVASGERVLFGGAHLTLKQRVVLMEELCALSTELKGQRSTGWVTHPSGGRLLVAGSDEQVIGHRFDWGYGTLSKRMLTVVGAVASPAVLAEASYPEGELLGAEAHEAYPGGQMAEQLVKWATTDPTPGDWDGQWAHEGEPESTDPGAGGSDHG